MVSAGQTVVTVASPDPRDAVFDIPEEFTDCFPVGNHLAISLLADPAVTATGVVREIAPQSDPATRTHRVRLTLDNPDASFRLGTTVRASLTNTAPSAIKLPETALLDDDSKPTVWVIGPNDKLVRQPVQLAARKDGVAAVASGLNAGERVLISGVHSVAEGQIVRVLEQ